MSASLQTSDKEAFHLTGGGLAWRRPRRLARAPEPAFMDRRRPIFCAWAELRNSLPRGPRSRAGRRMRKHLPNP